MLHLPVSELLKITCSMVFMRWSPYGLMKIELDSSRNQSSADWNTWRNWISTQTGSFLPNPFLRDILTHFHVHCLVQCTRMSKNSHFKMNFSVRHIIPGTFQNLKNLEYLYMDSNRIQRIEPSTFYGLNKLKYLGLSKNYLKTLDKVSHFLNRLAGIYAWTIDGASQRNARTDFRTEIH